MNPTHSITVGSAITLWELSEFSDQHTLETGLIELGMGEFAPAPRSNVASLHSALKEVMGGTRILIRPLDDEMGWCVVKEERGQTVNQYEHLLTARIDLQLRITFQPFNQDQADRVVNAFNKQSGYCHCADVRRSLVTILNGMKALCLRSGGGIYLLPEYRIDEWKKVGAVVEKASVTGRSEILILKNVQDVDAARTIQSTLLREVAAETERIATEIKDGVGGKQLGAKALDHRKDMLLSLREKVKEYEDLIGGGLSLAHELVDRTEESACKAALLATTVTEAVA